jgi:hypothetical protein
VAFTTAWIQRRLQLEPLAAHVAQWVGPLDSWSLTQSSAKPGRFGRAMPRNARLSSRLARIRFESPTRAGERKGHRGGHRLECHLVPRAEVRLTASRRCPEQRAVAPDIPKGKVRRICENVQRGRTHAAHQIAYPEMDRIFVFELAGSHRPCARVAPVTIDAGHETRAVVTVRTQ